MRAPELFPWFAEVTTLKGIGGQSKAALTRLLQRSIQHFQAYQETENYTPRLRDLLFHLPFDVIDRRYSAPVSELQAGKVATVKVVVEKHAPSSSYRKGGRRSPYRVQCRDKTGVLTLVFFHADAKYLNEQLPVGQERVVSGRLERYDGGLQMPHPDVIAKPAEMEKLLRIDPVYPLTSGVTQKKLSWWMAQALQRVGALDEWLDAELVKARDWLPFHTALFSLHRPEDAKVIQPEHPARMRLACDELLASQLALALVRQATRKIPGHVFAMDGALASTLEAALPFALTNGQQEVLKEIRADMQSGSRMLRLLQGDVGSGKTVVALLAAAGVMEEGYQAAVMAPTEILARQHYDSLRALLTGQPINVVLLTGSMSAKEQKAALEAIAGGEVHLIVGTHALFQQRVSFDRLGLVVIDEQHRFGVAQRMALSDKGQHPHILLMTATPIPRSLTMTLYGDLECSALTEKPANRQEIVTRVMPSSRMEDVYQGMERALADGARIYWVCPLVEGDASLASLEESDMQAAEDRFKALKVRFGDAVGLVHGKMKSADRQREMARFASGELRILVATTVIEVGVNVPETTVMIIENAERFGLSQLHQLRGRVGRSDRASSCLLLYGKRISDVAKERLKIIREHTDGFVIAEEDLRLRGGGEILGTRQSGLPDFLFADVYAHRELLAMARDDMKLQLHRDPHLTSPRGHALRNLLYLFGHDQSMRWLESG